jgi:hypothetical protein
MMDRCGFHQMSPHVEIKSGYGQIESHVLLLE